MNPKITVVSLVYNTPEAYLRQAIESVLNQTFTEFEYVIFNNGCTDNSPQIMAEYAAKDNRVRVVTFQGNIVYKGDAEFTEQCMSTIRQNMNQEYTCNLDSDDWYEPDFLELAYNLAKKNSADFVVGDFALRLEGDLNVLETRCCPVGVYNGNKEVVECWMGGYQALRSWWNKLFRSELIRRYWISRPADNGNATDNFMMHDIIGDSKVIASIGKVTHNYRVRKGSDSLVLSSAAQLVIKHVKKYQHGLGILKKLDGLQEQNIEVLRSVFRGGIVIDDYGVLEKARDTSPVTVMETIEKTFTDSDVNEVFGGFANYPVYFDQFINLANYLYLQNYKEPAIAGSFMTVLSRIWVRTRSLTVVNKKDIEDFIRIVFDERNIKRVGQFKLADMFKSYKAPFPERLALLNGEVLLDDKFLKWIFSRNSTEIAKELADRKLI
ncbi:MAG: glycosyltransferase family 2 protein [Clostridiales bacterium]|jgi:glycosyltransferase involved in cell wall biosynthesis|nr:glycosyltransferase family 2 protein [Clostridiales bacterium]